MHTGWKSSGVAQISAKIPAGQGFQEKITSGVPYFGCYDIFIKRFFF
jgi:hypothetical protein